MTEFLVLLCVYFFLWLFGPPTGGFINSGFSDQRKKFFKDSGLDTTVKPVKDVKKRAMTLDDH